MLLTSYLLWNNCWCPVLSRKYFLHNCNNKKSVNTWNTCAMDNLNPSNYWPTYEFSIGFSFVLPIFLCVRVWNWICKLFDSVFYTIYIGIVLDIWFSALDVKQIEINTYTAASFLSFFRYKMLYMCHEIFGIKLLILEKSANGMHFYYSHRKTKLQFYTLSIFYLYCTYYVYWLNVIDRCWIC